MLEEYIEFINGINKEIDAVFENQKDFVKCKSGCAKCCQDSGYKASFTEYEHLKLGMQETLTSQEIEALQNRALNIVKERNKFFKEKPGTTLADFTYECPCLVNNVCILYNYRPIICRVYGVPYGTSLANMTLPKCLHYGLNYSNVIDPSTEAFIAENFSKYNITVMPNFINYVDILTRGQHLNILSVKMIEDWIVEDIPDSDKLLEE